MIDDVNEVNFLGMIIDNKLYFKAHINEVIKKIKQLIPDYYKMLSKLEESGKKMFDYYMIYSIVS